MPSIAENISKIKSEIGSARLVAVTKGRSTSEIKDAIAAGICEIGENRLQEAMGKIESLRGKKIIFHMIGHLQSNKVKDAVRIFDVIQSVDSVRLAEKISKEATAQRKKIVAYMQVNVSGNETQGGIAAAEIFQVAEKIMALQSEFFVVEGLMIIASREHAREDFRKAKAIFDRLGLQVFSAGMTSDYGFAVGEGSNLVRIGTMIFGRRKIGGCNAAV